MKQQLFQYALLWHPNAEQIKEGKKSKLLKDLTTILSTDQKSAAIVAARAIPEDNISELDQVEVIIRPF